MTEWTASSWSGRRLLGVLCAAVAAALAIVGSFLSLVSGELSSGSTSVTLTVTGWDLISDGRLPAPGSAPQNGYPLVVAGGFLVIAAVLGLVAAVRGMPPGARTLAVLSGSVAAAFLAGTVATVAVQAANLIDTFDPLGTPDGPAGLRVSAGLGAGFWLELSAVVLAIAAVVLAALRDRAEPASPAPPSPD